MRHEAGDLIVDGDDVVQGQTRVDRPHNGTKVGGTLRGIARGAQKDVVRKGILILFARRGSGIGSGCGSRVAEWVGCCHPWIDLRQGKVGGWEGRFVTRIAGASIFGNADNLPGTLDVVVIDGEDVADRISFWEEMFCQALIDDHNLKTAGRIRWQNGAAGKDGNADSLEIFAGDAINGRAYVFFGRRRIAGDFEARLLGS